MKTSMLVLIIVACSCIIAGIVLLCVSFFMSGADLAIFSATRYIDNEYVFEEDFDIIEISDKNVRVELLPSEDDKCKIVLHERERMTHTASVTDKKLSIKINDERKFFDYIGIFNAKTPSITIYLPKKEYSSLSFSAGVGKVTLPDSFSFGDVDLSMSTGKITVRSNIRGTLTVDTSTVDTLIENASIASLKTTASTGDLCLKSVEIAQNAYISTTTGDVDLNNVNCANLSIKLSTGDISMYSVIASGEIKTESTTGDVEFERCDAATLKITTSTGDVEGSLLSDKIFYASSNTGKIRVPHSETGGKCEVECDTGNIIFTIVK